ncbi:MAG TPA: hypothetical protein PKD00_03205 [Burkholderiales bacterium]|nr:hypothetical protein [Burkholderiales bacterium]
MKTNKELVDYLNGLKIKQTSSWDEDIPEDVWNEYFEDKLKVVESDLYVEKHRWYETSVEIIKINDGFIGIESVTDTFSEQQEIRDCYHTLEFFEMEPVQTITYKIKK